MAEPNDPRTLAFQEERRRQQGRTQPDKSDHSSDQSSDGTDHTSDSTDHSSKQAVDKAVRAIHAELRRGNNAALKWLDKQVNKAELVKAYFDAYTETPETTLQRAAIELAGATGPRRNPKLAFVDGGTTGALRLVVPSADALTDTVFKKLTPDVQNDVLAQLTTHLGGSDRAQWLRWLSTRPVIRRVYFAAHHAPVTENVKLDFEDTDDGVILDRFFRMVPMVRKNYLEQINKALHSKNAHKAALCRSWLGAHPDMKVAYEGKFGGKVRKKGVLDPATAPAMKVPLGAFSMEFLRLVKDGNISFWNDLHDEYPLATHNIEKVTPALCEMLKGKYAREVRVVITDRDDRYGNYVTHKKLRSAMKRYIKLTYTDPGERAAMLAKLEKNLWAQPKHKNKDSGNQSD